MVELLIDILSSIGVEVTDLWKSSDKTIVNNKILVEGDEISIYTALGSSEISFVKNLDYKTRRYFTEDFINLNIHHIIG